jgi:hypothetical protein
MVMLAGVVGEIELLTLPVEPLLQAQRTTMVVIRANARIIEPNFGIFKLTLPGGECLAINHVNIIIYDYSNCDDIGGQGVL